ncbi:hypothetical protein D6833_02160 [Candidatus Parcubacteria bacterium]|nr:MAG: hypothetical protein D6833_02160 [Candidatus Parcubacteria bacterium]
MKTLQTYLFAALFLLGLILIAGCSQVQDTAAPEEIQAYAGKDALLSSSHAEKKVGGAKLDDPGNNANSPTGVVAQIRFEDNGRTLKITGRAKGLTPGIPYGSLIYDIGSSAEGSDACEPTIFDPSNPNFILSSMFVGIWAVNAKGEGKLSAINVVDDNTGKRVYVPLIKIGSISIRDLTVPGPFGPGSGPAAVVACGKVETFVHR